VNSIWHKKPKYKKHKLIDTFHGKVLYDMTRLLHGDCVDLGCGDKGAEVFFRGNSKFGGNYTGFDLPGFDIYKTDLECIEDFNIVLMNAFLDVLKKPLWALNKVLKSSREYVIIHRQEFSYKATRIKTGPAYGGWTYHSRINWDDFYKVIKKRRFYAVDYRELDFDNWENGGASLILKKY